jgi:hypothetical protein
MKLHDSFNRPMDAPMRLLPVLSTLLAATAFTIAQAIASPSASEPPRVTGPHTHANLSIFFLHGASSDGAVPLTLSEAMEQSRVRVIETGTVNALAVENIGDAPVFIQTGDIVKGGQQDRVLTVSLVLPPKSGRVPIAAFCVEHGRWAQRGNESKATFSASKEALPSNAAKLALAESMVKAPPAPAAIAGRIQQRDGTGDYQRKVWDEVAKTQDKLSKTLKGRVAAPQSESSLQLALENERVQTARKAYLDALTKAPGDANDVIGFAVAINGRITHADLYPSHGLFKKMWGKQLAAAVTEAIGAETDVTTMTPANQTDVSKFLASADAAKAETREVEKILKVESRKGAGALAIDARALDGKLYHRSYLAF